MYGNECISPPSPSTTSPASYLVASQVKAAMKNMSTLYQHLRSELVPPRVKTMAAAWQVWDSVQGGVGDTIHIDYDGEYGSERVLIVSGRATVVPDDGCPSSPPSPSVPAMSFTLCTASAALGAFSKAPSSSATVTLVLMARR